MRDSAWPRLCKILRMSCIRLLSPAGKHNDLSRPGGPGPGTRWAARRGPGNVASGPSRQGCGLTASRSPASPRPGPHGNTRHRWMARVASLIGGPLACSRPRPVGGPGQLVEGVQPGHDLDRVYPDPGHHDFVLARLALAWPAPVAHAGPRPVPANASLTDILLPALLYASCLRKHPARPLDGTIAR